jgi:hypothetical protein
LTPIVKSVNYKEFKEMMRNTPGVPPEAVEGVWEALLEKACNMPLEGEHHTCLWAEEGEDPDVEGVVEEFISEQVDLVVDEVLEGLKVESESEDE